MNINEWAKEIHENAVEHGWWESDRAFAEVIALCHSELSEALEEARAGRPMEWYGCRDKGGSICTDENVTECWGVSADGCPFMTTKPEGIAVELIDCIIRILDYLGKEGVDVEGIMERKHQYNKGRPYKHGKAF